MYYYFARSVGAGARTIWWREWVTTLQIAQFVSDGVTSLPFIVLWYYGYACKGTVRAWIVGNITGFLLFLLFAHFARTDKKKKTRSPDSGSNVRHDKGD